LLVRLVMPLFMFALMIFIILFPVLISRHVYLPLFIGFSGFLMIRGFEGDGYSYFWFPFFYLLNLEVNTSLPILLNFLSIVLFYAIFFQRIKYFKMCKICVAFMTVIGLNLFYFMTLSAFDFIFSTNSIHVDKLLLYSMLFDVIMVLLI